MICKPNELAMIVKPSKKNDNLIGRVVTTLYVAPDGDFLLPDGVKHFAIGPSRYSVWWVVEFSNPIDAPTSFGTRKTVYGCLPDSALRPIRGQPGEDEILRIAGSPNKQPEVA